MWKKKQWLEFANGFGIGCILIASILYLVDKNGFIDFLKFITFSK